MPSRTVTVILAGEAKKAVKALTRTEKAAEKLGKVSKIAGVGIAAMATAMAVKGVKSAIEFEKQLAEVQTLLPEITKDGIGGLRQGILDLSKDMGIATSEAVPALYQAISAGVPEKNVFKFMETASKASIGGVTDLKTAVDGITSVTNAYGVSNLSAQHAADLMFTTVRLGKTTFEELSGSIFNIAPIAAATGVSFEQVSAAMAALTAQGVPTSVATTQLRSAIQALSAPTIRQRKLINKLGLDFSATRLKQIGLSAAFKEAINATGGNMEQLRRLIGSVEGLQAVLALGGEQSGKFKEALAAMEDASGATDAAFGVMAETTAFKLNKATNEFNVILTELGAVALPAIVFVLNNTVTPALEWLTTKIAEAEAAIKTMKDVIGAAKNAFDDIDPGIGKFIESTGISAEETASWTSATGIAKNTLGLLKDALGESTPKIEAQTGAILDTTAEADRWLERMSDIQFHAEIMAIKTRDATGAHIGFTESLIEGEPNIQAMINYQINAAAALSETARQDVAAEAAHLGFNESLIDTIPNIIATKEAASGAATQIWNMSQAALTAKINLIALNAVAASNIHAAQGDDLRALEEIVTARQDAAPLVSQRELNEDLFGFVTGAAEGGIVRATPGGRVVRVGEGGQDEAIIPLGRGGSGAGGQQFVFNFNGDVYGIDDLEDRVSEMVNIATARGSIG